MDFFVDFADEQLLTTTTAWNVKFAVPFKVLGARIFTEIKRYSIFSTQYLCKLPKNSSIWSNYSDELAMVKNARHQFQSVTHLNVKVSFHSSLKTLKWIFKCTHISIQPFANIYTRIHKSSSIWVCTLHRIFTPFNCWAFAISSMTVGCVKLNTQIHSAWIGQICANEIFNFTDLIDKIQENVWLSSECNHTNKFQPESLG